MVLGYWSEMLYAFRVWSTTSVEYRTRLQPECTYLNAESRRISALIRNVDVSLPSMEGHMCLCRHVVEKQAMKELEKPKVAWRWRKKRSKCDKQIMGAD